MNADYRIMAAGSASGAVAINSTRSGMMIGAGVEYLLTPQWSAKFEYAVLDFANNSYFFGFPVIGLATANTQVHEIKVGVNYHVMPGMLPGAF